MQDFTGHLLVAMPGMDDPRFEKSVVFLCEYSAEGAMGLIVNKPAPAIRTRDILSQIGIEAGPETDRLHVHFGGPVECSRGFVLHSSDWNGDRGTLAVTDAVSLTATTDVLEEIAGGGGPDRAFLALGYAGWGPGQIEAELQANGWLICPDTDGIVFGGESGLKWSAALKSMGVDAMALSAAAGTA